VLFLDAEGRVKSEQRIRRIDGGFTGVLDPFDAFGYEVAAVGDLDGDGLAELAVSSRDNDDGGPNRGAV
jgi:hypothetical protein